MIIRLSSSSINNRAVDALLKKRAQAVLEKVEPRTSLEEDDHVLTILNLDANGREQRLLNPKILANKLIECGLLTHVTTIQLLISDIYPKKPMLGYATELSQQILSELPDSSITISLPSSDDLTDCILIEPPEDSELDWTLYSLPSDELNNLTPPMKEGLAGSFDFYRSKMTNISYKGSIHTLLQSIDSQIDPETIRQTFGP
ncbi:MAG: hypothetical protein CK424_03490 [Legionella sp.]|nr:MAG: hypothetical protein CK424_03490 [Legionella sp.]